MLASCARSLSFVSSVMATRTWSAVALSVRNSVCRQQDADVVGDGDDGFIAAGGFDSQEKIRERVVRPHLDPPRSTLTHAAW